MWLFTRHGFFSAVAGKDADGRPDPDTIVVRARNRRHLDGLRAEMTDELRKRTKVTESDDTDYPCRIVLPRADFHDMLQFLAECVGYTNFKDAAHSDEDYGWNTLLMTVWRAGHQYGEARSAERRPEQRPPNRRKKR